MSDLTRETLPKGADRRPLLPVEALGGTLYVRTVSVGQAAKFREDDEGFIADLLLGSVVFADGTQVWETEAEVLEYSMKDLRPIIDAAKKANGMSATSVEDAKGN